MRLFSPLGYFISGLTAVVCLANCSGGTAFTSSSSQLTAQSHSDQNGQSSLSQAARNFSLRLPVVPLPQRPVIQRKQFVDIARVNAPGGNEVIVSDVATASVLVYGGDGHLNAILVAGLLVPQGLTTDSSGTLYVADGAAHNVFLYKKPYTSITQTLNDADQVPVDVAVSATGVVAVMNIAEPTGGFGSVSFYVKGSPSACANVGSPYFARIYFGAFDAAGDLIIDGQDPFGNTIVGKVSGGCKATSITTLTTQNKIVAPGGLQVADGKIMIADQVNKAIYTYPVPTGTALGSPTVTTNLSQTGDPVGIAARVLDRNVWVADATYFANATEYAYPSGAVVKSAYAQFALVGIAVNPAPKP